MKKYIYIVLIVVAVLAAASFLIPKSEVPQGKMVTGSDIETFSGTIESVNTGCFADGICSVTVDGKEVIVLTGWGGMRPDAVVGKLIGVESIGEVEERIGDHANVYAAVTEDGKWTLYGDTKYYLEVVKLKNN